MNAHQHLVAESFASNKEMVAIFDETMVGQQRLHTIKWIRELLEKPKHASKEEERLRGLCTDTTFIEEVLKGDTEYRMNYFNQLVEQLLNEFSSKHIKKGNLYVRSLTLKIWKERKVQLDEDKKQFLVLSKDKIKVLDLAAYSIKWLGQKKEYQAFSLESASSNNRYKQLMFGWTNFDSSRIWHDAIIKVISLNSLPKEDQLSTRNDTFQNRAQSEEEELEKAEKPSNKLLLRNSKVPVDEPAHGQQVFQVSDTDSSYDGGNSARKDNQNISPTQLLQQKSTPLSQVVSNSDSKIKTNKMSSSSNLSSNSLTKPVEVKKPAEIIKPIEVIKSSDTTKPAISSQSYIKKVEIKSPERPIQVVEQQKSTDSLPSSIQTDAARQMLQDQSTQQTQSTQNLSAIKQPISPPQKVEVPALIPSPMTSSNLETKTHHFEEEIITTPPAIQSFLQEYKLSTLEQENDFNTISFNGGIRFLQSYDDPRRFKIFLALQGPNAFEVFNCICNTDDYSKWNNNVAETRILNVMRNERTAIIYQKHKAIGIMYRPRDFVYLRHSFVQNDTYYIIDKSIEYESLPNSMSVVRGEIEHVVWSFKDHQNEENRCLMTGDFFINNQGYSNKEQDASITFAYLKNFANLSGFISQKSFQKSITVNMFDINRIGQLKKSPVKLLKDREEEECKNQSGNDRLEKADQPTIQLFQLEEPKKEQAEEQANKNIQVVVEDNSQQFELKNENNEEMVTSNSQEAKDEEEDIYEQEEIQNQTLNMELNKFSLQELSQQQQNGEGEGQSSAAPLTHEVLSKRPGDKLAGLTIPQIVDLVNKNKIWSICLDQYYPMGRINCEEKRLQSDPINGNYQFKKDWERDPKTGKFIFLNKEKIAAQKKVISFILSKIGSNIISGKSIMNISLPIDIFEPRSNTERFAYGCSFAPVFLKRAGQETDPIEQMKNTAVYLITTTIMYLNLEKPFNPILGETYQGRLDGFPIYAEQISHHPPICAYQYYTDTYVLNGQLESAAQMHANSVTGINQGNVTVTFYKTKNSIGTIQAPGSLNGTAFGVRYMSVEGRYIAYDLTNKLVFEVKLNPDKKGLFKSSTQPIDYFAGGIYRVTDKFITKFKNLKPAYYKFAGLNMKEDIVEQVSVVNGIWNQEIIIDDKKWFDLESPLPYVLESEINPLASDSSFRQDILHFKDGNKVVAQEFKEKLEVFQRNDKKLREKAYEIAKKLKKHQSKK